MSEKAMEHLERCRFYAENDTEMSAEEAAKLSEFRASLFAARQARVTNGTSAPALATTAISLLSDPRQDPTALYNMRDVIILEKLIDVALAEKFREQARKPKFRLNWSEVILPEALDLIKLRLNNMTVELGPTREAAETRTPEGQTLLAVAEMICDLFGRPTRRDHILYVYAVLSSSYGQDTSRSCPVPSPLHWPCELSNGLISRCALGNSCIDVCRCCAAAQAQSPGSHRSSP
jgi:hypothetical protein